MLVTIAVYAVSGMFIAGVINSTFRTIEKGVNTK